MIHFSAAQKAYSCRMVIHDLNLFGEAPHDGIRHSPTAKRHHFPANPALLSTTQCPFLLRYNHIPNDGDTAIDNGSLKVI